MSFLSRTRPSPAMIVACVALSFALAGSAVAGTEAVTSAITKAKVKKIAKRVANKQIKKKAPGLSVAHADTADSATSATSASNADTVDGKHAADLESHGFSVTSENVTINAGPATTTVQTLDLAAGTYLVMARAEFNNNDAAAALNQLDCELRAGGVEVDLARNMFLGANGAVGDSEVGAASLIATLAAADQARIVCDADAGWDTGNALDPTITAVSIQP